MQEAVSDILIDRAREADGLARMVGYSLALHAALVATIYFLPSNWMGPRTQADAMVMTISIAAGAQGPQTGGMTPIAGRPVQQVAPPPAKPVAQPAPAAKPPEMVALAPTAKPLPTPPPKAIEKPAETSASRKPTTGAEIKEGSARVNTGGEPVPFGGLTTGGGVGTGVRTDVGNFCCPAYIQTMVGLIRANWNSNQGTPGTVEMRFTILRDGTLTNIGVEKSSGAATLDMESTRAVSRTRRLPPLPAEFDRPTLTVYVLFPYQR